MFSKVVLYKNKVYIYYKRNKVLLRYDTGIKITNKNQFSEKNGIKSNVKNYKEMNSSIFSLQRTIDGIILKYKDNPSINIDRKFVHNEIHKEKLRKDDRLLDYYNEFLEWKKNEIEENSMSINSLKDYKSIKNTILDYEKQFNTRLKLIEINKKEFITKYKIFQQKKRDRKKGYKTSGGLSQSTLHKRMILFYSFLKYIQDQKYFSFDIKLNQSGNKKKVKKTPKKIDVLSIEEVRFIKNLTLEDEFERKVKDVFVFSCLTGLRWSDIISLEEPQIKTNNTGIHYILKESVKNDVDIEIPLNETSLEILKRYNYSLKFTTNQQYNRCLKKIFKDTNRFNEEISKKKEDGTNFRRYEVMSIHKGRHTFVSNLIEKGTPVNVIMKYTGHSKLETLMVYITMKVKPTLQYVSELE